MSSRNKKSKGTDKKKDNYPSQGFPPFQMYPLMTGYPPPHWVAPNIQPNFQNPWCQPWTNQQQFHRTNSSWIPEQTVKLSPKNIPEATDNEYMVNSVRRIYNNDDGSIEIERVKVHRRSGHYDTKLCNIDYPKSLSSSHSVVSAPSFEVGERRPPPRRYKRNKDVAKLNSVQGHHGDSHLRGVPQNWYPFFPYMSQMYHFPHPYSYIWSSPISAHFDSQSHTDESDCSRHEVHPSSPESSRCQKLDPHDVSRVTSSDFLRTTSSAATSHVTESHVTDIGPSDSISMRGFKRKTSLENMRTSVISDKTDSSQSAEAEKAKDWMQDMKKTFSFSPGYQSDATGDRSSFITANSEIPTPPIRIIKQTKIKRKKSNSESDVRLADKLRSATSPPLLSNTRVSESDLTYAYKKLENAVKSTEYDVKKRVSCDSSKVNTGTADDSDERHSRASTMSFHSTRQSADSHDPVDTDSTDIALPTDTATADESTDHLDSETPVSGHSEINYKWVLQDSEEGLLPSQQEGTDEREINLRDSWKAEVSLWRALLVVSLCNGQGLDQSDWNTFQLLVQHPLSISSKLTLLNARRLCSLNCDLGVVFLRNSLLHLTTYGEMLLKQEKGRPAGWKVIAMDGSQLWSPMNGSLEILYVFGYRLGEDGILRYHSKCAPETAVISRMTLDILVLAEEFRLYLNGISQNTMEITQLFAPLCSSPVTVHNLPSSNDIHNNKTEQDLVLKLNQFENQNSNFEDAPEKSQSVSDIFQAKDIVSTRKIVSVNNDTSTPVTSTSNCKDILSRDSPTKKQNHDNPEDHIYEEITEVKLQVESIKLREKIYNKPPPLPPKSRIKPENLYPSMDMTISSQCNSAGGSTSSRTKKRRAPMPPSFMISIESKEDGNVGLDKNTRPNENQKELNPFYEKHEKASGYVGKNPFYEDVKLKNETKEQDSITDKQKASSLNKSQEIIQSTLSDERTNLQDFKGNQINYTQDTTTINDDEITHTAPSIRPERKKMQSRSNSNENKIDLSNQYNDELLNGNVNGQQEDKSSGSDSQTSSIITVKNSDIVKLHAEDNKSSMNNTLQNHDIITSKNGEWEQQNTSHVVVPNSNLKTERNRELKNDFQEINTPCSKSEIEKENTLLINSHAFNIPTVISEKDKEIQFQSDSQKLIVPNNKPENRNEMELQIGSQRFDVVENKSENKKEDELQSAFLEANVSNIKSKSNLLPISNLKTERNRELKNDFQDINTPCSKSEIEKENTLLINSHAFNIPAVISEKDKEIEFQSDSQKLIVPNNKSENRNEMELQIGSHRFDVVENKSENKKEDELQSAFLEANVSNIKSKNEKNKKIHGEPRDVVVPSIISENDKNGIIQTSLQEAVALDRRSVNEKESELPSDSHMDDSKSDKSVFEKELATSNVPTFASDKVTKIFKSKTQSSKQPDVIIKEIIISYDISLNGSCRRTTKDEKEKGKNILKLDKTKDIASIFSLNKKSILDTIEFIDAEENYPILGMSQEHEMKAADKDIDIDLNNQQGNDRHVLIRKSDHIFQNSQPKIKHSDQTLPSSVTFITPKPLDISPPPTPPLCSPPKSLSSSPSFISQTLIKSQIKDDSSIKNFEGVILAKPEKLSPSSLSLKDTESQDLSLSIVLPETPHTSPPPSPVKFQHSINKSLEDSESSNTSKTNVVDENSKTLEDASKLRTNMSADCVTSASTMTFSLHGDKENIMFKHANLGTSETDERNQQNENSDKETFEERYEIPDVLKAEENMKRMKESYKHETVSHVASHFTPQELMKLPERPPRHRYFHKVPPPLPPKPHEHNAPPELPPKGISSPVVQTKQVRKESLHSQSAGTKEKMPHVSHSLSPSPLAIPSVSPQLYTAPAINELRQLNSKAINQSHDKTNSATLSLSFREKCHKDDNTKSRQKFYVPTKSVSMPSSPKASRSRLKHETKTEKERKSWPFQLCNCLYTKDYKKDQIKIKYVRE